METLLRKRKVAVFNPPLVPDIPVRFASSSLLPQRCCCSDVTSVPPSSVKVEVIHNASVMGAVASCGLQLYNFGQTVSIPLWEENWEPDSFHEKIRVNKAVRFALYVAPSTTSTRPGESSILDSPFRGPE